MAKNNSLVLHIQTRGDRSVGIEPMSVEIETNWPDMPDDMRKHHKNVFGAALHELSDFPVQYAFFSDECPECGIRKVRGKYPDSKKASHY